MKRLLSLFAFLSVLTGSSAAADFGISPIKLYFDRQTRSAVVTVSNEADQPLVVEMALSRWTQDGQGKDVYTDSEDFQFFPRLMSIPPKDKRIIRIGVRTPIPGDDEVTYRLFINEILAPQEKATTSQVSLAFRFALPIFVSASKPAPRAQIIGTVFVPGVGKDAGKVVTRVTLRNDGNENFRSESLRLVQPQGLVLAEVGGWYLLPGISREHLLLIPPIDCKQHRQLEISVKTDKPVFSELVDVPAIACLK